jgi:signal peptidase II
LRKGQASVSVSVALVTIACDYAAKQVAGHALAGSQGLSLAGGNVRFELASNAGAFLSLGASLPTGLRDALLLVGVPVLLAIFCATLLRGPPLHRRGVWALGLIVGGGLANWLDRLLHDGAVTDFVSLGIGPVRTGIFNAADVAIVAGVLLLLLPGGDSAAKSRDS